MAKHHRTRKSSASARMLVQCTACHRQYDATGHAIESRFRCHCGEEVLVRAPRGHDAEVVRCSNCGAPREALALSCGFCCSDFTLHERDLETVCPACQARVSNRAKFCHHCGTGLNAELVAGEITKLHCPACESQPALVSRTLPLEKAAIFECPRCVGMWLSIGTLNQILESEPREGGKAPGNHVPSPPPTAQGYRPCVECGGLMARRNFGFAASGVIVDICGKHGIWFDANEFMQLLAWVRAGGLEAARDDLARLSGSPDKVRQRAVLRRISTTPTPTTASSASPAPFVDNETTLGRGLDIFSQITMSGDLIAAVISALFGK